jgi:beta-phosphoglucomutase-like phosphatase (HAD superfamily)
MVAARDVKYGKPNPEPYLMGMQKAGGLTPRQTMVVENAPLGVEAGVAAGCFVIAVNTGPLPDSVLLDQGANLLFHSMTDLSENIASIIYEANHLNL